MQGLFCQKNDNNYKPCTLGSRPNHTYGYHVYLLCLCNVVFLEQNHITDLKTAAQRQRVVIAYLESSTLMLLI